MKGEDFLKIRNKKDVVLFLETVNKCEGDVFLTSNQGDKINLKSELSQYVAIAALLGEKGDELELFCTNSRDENRFFELFSSHSEYNVGNIAEKFSKGA